MENNILTDKQEYYTLEISDLFVGYEFQMNHPDIAFKKPETEGWCDSDTNWFDNDFEHIRECIEAGIIRTPYLTKEQIETEGWKFKGKSVDLWWEKEGTFDMGSFRVYKIIMHYGMKGHIGNQDLKMHIYAEDQGTEYDLFRGIVTSINEFRKLQNWLGIK